MQHKGHCAKLQVAFLIHGILQRKGHCAALQIHKRKRSIDMKLALVPTTEAEYNRFGVVSVSSLL